MKNYPTEVPSELEKLWNISQCQQEEIDKEKERKPGLWEMIRFKVKADWTYNSNAIEG